jgi:hypothetical protein
LRQIEPPLLANMTAARRRIFDGIRSAAAG